MKKASTPASDRPDPRPGSFWLGDSLDAPYTATAVIDDQGVVTGWSTGARRLLGYHAADIVGRSAAILLAEEIVPEPVQSSLAELPRWNGRVTLLHRDGHRLKVEILAHHRTADSGGSEWIVVSSVMAETRPLEHDVLMEWAFGQGPCAMAIYGSDLRLRRANRDMQCAFGLTEDEMRGLRVSEIVLDPHLEEVDECIRQVLESGEPRERENFFRTPGKSRKQAWAVRLTPLRNQDDQILAVCLAAHDITEQYWARERLLMLNEAGARIGRTLEVVRTAQEMADVVVPKLADSVDISLLASLDQGEPPTVPPAGPITMRHAARSVIEDGPAATLEPGEITTYSDDPPQVQCLRSGRSFLYDTPGDWALHSMAVPLRASGTALGVAVFARHRLMEPFDQHDLLLAEEITARAAVCIDNAYRYSRERETALTLQHSLLPQRLPQQAAVEVASRYLPAGARAGAGGDWFDVIPLSGARVALVVGDVVGHGIQASATMGRLRTAVRTLADVDLPPDELLIHLDDLVTHLAAEVDSTGWRDGAAEAPGEIGATCLYAVYDPVTRRCGLSRAGHQLPVVVSPGGTVEFVDLSAEPPLGMGGLNFECTEIELPAGSLLVLYTDGLVEARHRDSNEGLEILRKAIARPDQSLDTICDNVLEALLPSHPPDDVALLIARTRALDASQVATWDLPARPAIVAQARRNASKQLALWGLDEAIFTTELVVSELVTNAIRYGDAPIQLRLIYDRSLICEVSDASSTAPHLRRARVYDEGGRGLLLVAQLTQRWGTRHTTAGKTIWAIQTLSGDNGTGT
ncbi:SpoIIE family protein phosphatase [Streptosporangium soli]|nr:SpoIIE family protein phosphatase [Streptosporangium sp. KLBMP 9127]